MLSTMPVASCPASFEMVELTMIFVWRQMDRHTCTHRSMCVCVSAPLSNQCMLDHFAPRAHIHPFEVWKCLCAQFRWMAVRTFHSKTCRTLQHSLVTATSTRRSWGPFDNSLPGIGTFHRCTRWDLAEPRQHEPH